MRVVDDRRRVVVVVERQGVEHDPGVFRDAPADLRRILLREEARLHAFQVMPERRFLRNHGGFGLETLTQLGELLGCLERVFGPRNGCFVSRASQRSG
jgi:hypothetical protein